MRLLTCTQERLMAGLRAASAVDMLLTDEDWLRRYRHTAQWRDGVELVVFGNGSGDEMAILSGRDGAIIKGFDHESPVSPYARDDHSLWPGIRDGAPPQLLSLLDDPATGNQDITFLHWLTAGQREWRRGPVAFPGGEDDGSDWLLGLLPTTAQEYIDIAKGYFGEDFGKIDQSVIRARFGD